MHTARLGRGQGCVPQIRPNGGNSGLGSFDRGLRIHNLRLGGTYGRVRCCKLRLGRTDGGFRALRGCAIVIQNLLRDSPRFRQLPGTGQTALCCIKLGFPLGNGRFGRRMFCLPLRHKALCRIDTDFRPAQLCLRLPVLAFKLVRVHAGQNIARFDEAAFICKNFTDAAGAFRGNIDFNRLDAAIAAGNPVRQPAAIHRLQGIIAARSENDNCACNDPLFAAETHNETSFANIRPRPASGEAWASGRYLSGCSPPRPVSAQTSGGTGTTFSFNNRRI